MDDIFFPLAKGVHGFIASDREQPGGKASIFPEFIKGFKGSEKCLCGYIFCLMHIPDPAVEIPEDLVHIQLIQLTKYLGILSGGSDYA